MNRALCSLLIIAANSLAANAQVPPVTGQCDRSIPGNCPVVGPPGPAGPLGGDYDDDGAPCRGGWFHGRVWDAILGRCDEQENNTPAPPLQTKTDYRIGAVFPDSSTRYLTPDELGKLSAGKLRIARNEIYARNGRFFKDPALRSHFSQFGWYNPTSWDVPLNPIEKVNVKVIASFEGAKAAAKTSILVGPIGAVSPQAGTGDTQSSEVKRAKFERLKSDAFRQIREIAVLRDQCREKRSSCSANGLAYDEREALRRRDRQYFIWGEVAYYIPSSDALVATPPELKHEMGTLGGVKLFGYGADWFYIYVIKGYVHYGSTPIGGQGAAALGYKKAFADNNGFKPW